MGIGNVIAIPSPVNDRDSAKSTAARKYQTSLMRFAQSLSVGHGPSGNDIAVLVVPSYPLVDLDKLLCIDLAKIEGNQPILHTDIIEWAMGKTRPWAAP